MKVYRVYNGYIGFSAVHKIVIADNEKTALEKVLSNESGNGWSKQEKLSVDEVVFIDGVEVGEHD
jgi:hypothetical protein